MKKVISFCIWGSNLRYTIGALENAKLQKLIYPDWISRFYVSDDVPLEIIKQLIEIGVEIVHMNGYSNWSNATMWRFLPAADSDVDVMISRDTDSRLTEREKIAVDEWLSSDKNFHLIRDHPWHGEFIMAGMWGVRNHILSNIKTLINNFSSSNYKENDQRFLATIIYPRVKNNCFIHDEFRSCIGKFPELIDEKTFIIKHNRIDCDFIGNVYDENNIRDMYLCDILKKF